LPTTYEPQVLFILLALKLVAILSFGPTLNMGNWRIKVINFLSRYKSPPKKNPMRKTTSAQTLKKPRKLFSKKIRYTMMLCELHFNLIIFMQEFWGNGLKIRRTETLPSKTVTIFLS